MNSVSLPLLGIDTISFKEIYVSIKKPIIYFNLADQNVLLVLKE